MRIPHSFGFTLLELMIVVAIVAVLAGIAYPSYQDSIRKARRADAKAALLEAAGRQERFYTENNQYTNVLIAAAGCATTPDTIKAATDCGLRYPTNPNPPLAPDSYYSLTLNAPLNAVDRRSAYTLTATPVTGKSQEKDISCQAFTLNNLGVKCIKNGSLCSNGNADAQSAVRQCW